MFKRVAIVALVFILFSVLAPEAGGPQLTARVDASDGWYTKHLDWWVDYGLWKVKHSVSWQVKNDDHVPCYTSWPTESNGTGINKITDPPVNSYCYSKYSTYVSGVGYVTFKAMPIRNITLSCWVPYAIGIDVRIDVCTILPSSYNGYEEYGMETIGSIHRACNLFDPFKVACVSFRSRLLFHGRGVSIWNSAL